MKAKSRNIDLNKVSHSKRFLFVFIFFCTVGVSAFAQEGNLYVIANSKGAPDQLKFSELVSAMKGQKQRWPDRTKVYLVFMKSTTAVGKMVSKKIFDMTPDEENMYWTRNTFSGNVETPKTCNSLEEFQSFLSENPGAIGIADKAIDNSGLKTVLIDGKKAF